MWDRARAARCCWLPIIPSARSLGSSFLLNWTASHGLTSRVIPGHVIRPPVICIQGDAAEFPWPAGPLIVYMWNAFTGPVMERVFQNLEASLVQQPRELYLVYIHPELESMLAGLPWLIRLWRDEFAMSEEDYAAWAFPNRAEVCAVYRSLP